MPSRLSSTDPPIARQVERQMRNWELASSQRVTETQPSESARLVEDFICVSRQVGAEGGVVARALRSLMQSEFVRNDYFRKLSETLLSLTRQSHCILVGRGADLLLPEEVGFRARLVPRKP